MGLGIAFAWALLGLIAYGIVWEIALMLWEKMRNK